MKKTDIKKLTFLALMTAIVAVLQFVGAFKLGIFSVCPVLIPIVLGAAICGPLAGAWLGLVFSVVVLLSGDAAAFLAVDVLGTILTVILKGTLAGYVSGVLYKLVSRRSVTAGAITAAVAAPVVNTGVFLLGCLVFFLDTVAKWGESLGFASTGAYMIFGLAGANFLFEFGLNMVLCPVIIRLIGIRARSEKVKW